MEHNNDNDNEESDAEEFEPLGSLVELDNLIDLRTKQTLDSLDVFQRLQGFKATQKLLHQAEMLNPVRGVIIVVDGNNELYLMSTSHEPSEVLHLLEVAKKRLV